MELQRISDTIKKMADPDIFTWLPEKRNPDKAEIVRASTIVADRLCGAVADPIIRNAQEKRQFAAITEFLQSKGYTLTENSVHYYKMDPGSFPFIPMFRFMSRVSKVKQSTFLLTLPSYSILHNRAICLCC